MAALRLFGLKSMDGMGCSNLNLIEARTRRRVKGEFDADEVLWPAVEHRTASNTELCGVPCTTATADAVYKKGREEEIHLWDWCSMKSQLFRSVPSGRGMSTRITYYSSQERTLESPL